MNPKLKPVVWGFMLGMFISMLAWFNLPHKDLPPANLKPYEDTIRILQRENKLAAARAAYHLHRADSLERRLHANKKKLKDDIKIIETLTPDLLVRWHDSTMRANGYR